MTVKQKGGMAKDNPCVCHREEKPKRKNLIENQPLGLKRPVWRLELENLETEVLKELEKK